MSHTNFVSSQDLIPSLSLAVRNLQNNLSKIDRAFSEERTVLKKNTYHFITRLLKPYNRVERTVYALIFKTAYQSEMLSAGSGYLSVVFSTGLAQAFMKEQNFLVNTNQYQSMEHYQGEGLKVREIGRTLSKRCTLSDINKNIEQVCENESLALAVKEAVELAGLEGMVHVEEGHQSSYVVEMKHGYHFDMIPYRFFMPEVGPLELKHAKVLLVDGMIEKVSELEHLLLKSAATKIPMIIVAQGFEEEVVATLKANQDRGTFNVIPVRLQPDLQGLNVLNDLASVAGTDIISSHKGETVVFKKYEDIVSVENVRLFGTAMTIQNNETKGQVAAQVRLLMDKRSQNHDIQDISTLYDKRIQSLLAHTVTIRLPNMTKSAIDDAKMKIDIALRTNKTLLAHGTVDIEKVIKSYEGQGQIGKIMKEALEATLVEIPVEDRVMPTLSVYTGLWFSGITMLSLFTSGGLVEIVD